MAQDGGPEAQGLGLGLELGGVSTATGTDAGAGAGAATTTTGAADSSTNTGSSSPALTVAAASAAAPVTTTTAGADTAQSKGETEAAPATTVSPSNTTGGATTDTTSELDGSGLQNGQGGQTAMDAHMPGRHLSQTLQHATHSLRSTSTPTPASSYPQTTAAYQQTSHAPQSQYASYGSPTPQHDPYRGSGSPMPLDAVSQQQQQQHQNHQHAHQQQHTLPHGAASAMHYYAQQPLGHLPSNYALASDRFGIHDPRLRHGQPKKEIKRRTKTGCLTCRKRRIKCDEAHPTCNNCKKSKRECLGYDPIFRQQTVHLVNNYSQSLPDQQHTVPSQEDPQQSLPASHTGPSPAAPGSAPAHSGQIDQSYRHPHPPDRHGSVSTPDAPAVVKTEHNTKPLTHTAPPPPSIKSETASPNLAATSIPQAEPARLPVPDPQPRSQVIHTSAASSAQQRHPSQIPSRTSKMKIDEIIDLLGPPAPPQQVDPNDNETINEITQVYHEMYAAALSAFFETDWYYFTENGKTSFPKDPDLVAFMATFLKILRDVKANDQEQMAYSGVLETRIVWRLAKTAASSGGVGSAMRISLPPENDPSEARSRLLVVEALLSGEYLPSNPLTAPMQDASARGRQFDFWYLLGEFVRHPDPMKKSEVAAEPRDDVLSRMRLLLDGRENRDVLYSIAIVRELGPYFPLDYASTLPQHLDEADPKNRLAVASKFLIDESQVTGGTTNVVRRFSDIAARSYIIPGVNIARLVRSE